MLANKLDQEKRSNASIKTKYEYQITELQQELKRKSSSPPQPKPRTNIITKHDGRIAQLERERDEIKANLKLLQERYHQEKVSRDAAEEKWMTLKSHTDSRQDELEEYKRKFENVNLTKSRLETEITTLETKVKPSILSFSLSPPSPLSLSLSLSPLYYY